MARRCPLATPASHRRRSQFHKIQCKISATVANRGAISYRNYVRDHCRAKPDCQTDRQMSAQRAPDTATPHAQQQPRADHSAEMREMRDPFLRAGDAQKKLER